MVVHMVAVATVLTPTLVATVRLLPVVMLEVTPGFPVVAVLVAVTAGKDVHPFLGRIASRSVSRFTCGGVRAQQAVGQ